MKPKGVLAPSGYRGQIVNHALEVYRADEKAHERIFENKRSNVIARVMWIQDSSEMADGWYWTAYPPHNADLLRWRRANSAREALAAALTLYETRFRDGRDYTAELTERRPSPGAVPTLAV